MMIPPAVFWLKIKRRNQRGFALWLPLFVVLWPLLLLVAAVMLVFWLLFLPWAVWTSKGRKQLSWPMALYLLLCSLKGLSINVNGKDQVQLVIA